MDTKSSKKELANCRWTLFPTVAGALASGPLFLTVLISALLAGMQALAQTPAIELGFQDAPGTTTASTGTASVSLTMYNASGAATDLHGAVGTGVNGAVSGRRCLNFSAAPNYGGALAPNCYANNSAALGLGSVSSFTVTEWMKEDAFQPPLNGLLGRMFVLGAGAAGTDINAANTIGMKWQQPNQWNVSIGTGNPTASAVFSANLPTNKWIFMGIVYDGTNVYIYQGSDSASAQLISTTSAPGLVENIGSTGGLYVGNRYDNKRGFSGWIDDFRFYPNYAGSLNFVDGIRQTIAPKIPTITGVYPDGSALMQATNVLTFTAVSSSGLDLTNIDLKVNSVDVTAACTFVTNGAGVTNVTVQYANLPQQTINTVLMTAIDGLGLTGSATVIFDTFSATNFVVKAEEFDFNGGQFIDNPDYTNQVDPNSYFGQDSMEGIDTHKGQSTGDNQATDYRYDDGTGLRTQTPQAVGELPSPTRFGNGGVPNHMIGNWSSAEWQNYTKTFPPGNYNVYARLSTSSGSTVSFDQVTSGQGTASQTLARLGQFTLSGSGAFQWVPLRQFGSLAVVNLGGSSGGVATVRATTGGGANADFYMLVAANTNLPTITSVYPDGEYLFEATNTLVFTAGSGAPIPAGNIVVTLNGMDVSSNLVFTGGPFTWNVSYTGLQLNQTYNTVIQVTDSNGNSANATLSIDTWNPVLQVEAEDFDFDPALSPVSDLTDLRFIDNPLATPPGRPASNSYEGQIGDVFIDEQGNNLQNGLNPIQNALAGATMSNYRTNDPCATAPVTDARRRQFGAGVLDYNVGFLGAGHWEQYTRTWPSGTYNLYARVASGANLGTLYSSWSEVIAGWGTTNQVTRHVGSFAIPSSGGYSSYFYAPLLDRFGNYATMTLGGTNTFRDTHLVFNQTETPNTAAYGLNINFYMLLNARTDLPRIDGVYPDGSVLMQQNNALSFVASSPGYGISTNNIQVTLNGVTVSNLVFSGSASSWNVSCPLQPNLGYTAVISITDLDGQVHSTTVSFDTFSANDFTWEAEDFDFDPANSPMPNGSGLRFIDNPVPTSMPATNSYYGQQGDLGTDYSVVGTPFPTLYRPNDYISLESTGDAIRAKYQNAQLAQVDPYIADYDIYDLTNGFVDYTRTFPAGNFYVYARLAAGGTAPLNFQLAQVTSGAGTSVQTTNVLGKFQATGNSYATWQYAPLVSLNTGQPVIVPFTGGVETLSAIGDGLERVNFFMLVPLTPNSVAITPSISGANVTLSFPTQNGFTYTLYYKVNLTDSTWLPLVGGGNPVAGNGSVQSVTDSLGQSHRFYRLGIQ